LQRLEMQVCNRSSTLNSNSNRNHLWGNYDCWPPSCSLSLSLSLSLCVCVCVCAIQGNCLGSRDMVLLLEAIEINPCLTHLDLRSNLMSIGQ
jgi:hypothetical protein